MELNNGYGYWGLYGFGSISNASITYGGVTFEVGLLSVDSDSLDLGSDFDIIPSALSGSPLVLHVGASQFPLANASVTGSGRFLTWSNPGLDWSSVQRVAVRLVDPTAPYVPPPPPTVDLSVGPYRSVAEGSDFYVTATLSESLPNTVRIPLTLTNHTAEADDYETKYIHTGYINIGGSGQTQHTQWFQTNHDADGENEEFTVAIDTANLPPSLTAGRPSSVRIKIHDDEASDELSVWLWASPNPVREGGTVTVTVALEIGGSPTVTQYDEIIPLRVRGVTSEAGDHGTLGSITIPRYSGSATATIVTRRDADGADEMFVVELGRLPAHLARGRCGKQKVMVAEGGGVKFRPCNDNEKDDMRLRLLGLSQ